jgi:putative DNA methylase
LFTDRQLVALTTFSNLVLEAREKVLSDARSVGTLAEDDRTLDADGVGKTAYADAVTTYLGIASSRSADYWSGLCSWHVSRELIRNTMNRQALPMVWDFCEGNPIGGASGDWSGALVWTHRVLERLPATIPGTARQLDATAAIDGIETPVLSTDPPYYDNIGYADLSDFFYSWLRRSLGSLYPQLFSTVLTPKTQELIASPYRHEGSKEKAKEFFEEGLGKAFSTMREAQNRSIPLTVFYAFKQAESDGGDVGKTGLSGGSTVTASTGWETMLAGLFNSGFSVLGTWPMRTELGNRTIGMDANVLASSIVLVCRPRLDDAPLATRREFLAALKEELPEALTSLQHGNIAPVDLAQASIGPGMAVFTRYSKVMESDGSPMSVRTALGLINQTLDAVLAEQEGEFDPDTRWAIAWFDQFGMEEGPFGVAETLSKAKNTAVEGLVEAGILEAGRGKVRLLKRDELFEDWDPAKDKRFTSWEAGQYLIQALDQQGEQGAAALLRKLGGGHGETARDLAYRLYNICERKGWASEALAYNSLVIAWPEITRLAHVTSAEGFGPQTGMFESE